MRRVLLIADLEGVAGVDELDSLAFGAPGYPQACLDLTAEVNAAVEGLLRAGFDRVRVSDSHRAGGGTSNLGALDPAAELELVEPDYYGGALLDDVAAVACLGMHAAGGEAGFASHTVHLHTAWSWAGAPLSEAEIALGLAAERGIPALFVAGDDVLGRRVSPRCPYVVTKRSSGVERCESHPPAEVRAELKAAAQEARLCPLPRGERLVVKFKSERYAAAAARAGATRCGPFAVSLSGPTFTLCYERALEVIAATSPLLLEEISLPVGSAAFVASARRLLAAPFPD